MRREELEAHLAELLRTAEFDDESSNGLQVEGREEIRRVALSVTACAEAFSRAVEGGADALIVHHGLFWKGRLPDRVRGTWRERLALLLRHDLSLFAYHLPLDAHPELGNNAVAARELGFGDLQPFLEYHGRKIGWKGTLPQPVERAELTARLERYFGHRAFVVPAGPATIRTAGFASGGAAWEAPQAAAEKLDLYVTGESAEPVVFLCRELGLNFAALGHHATERIGVRTLGQHLRAKLGLDTFQVELENEA